MTDKKILAQLNNVSFGYPGEDPLVEDIKLTVTEGEITALVGINGSGKSTLLKLLSGDLTPTVGESILHCKVYYVPQVDLTVHQEGLSIYEYISEYYENWWEVPNETEKLFGLSIDTEAAITTLSGGEIMKLNLAIALLHKPDVLILDEPTNHLDVKSTSNLIDFIKSTAKNRHTFLIVSHDTFFLDAVVTKTLELENKNLTVYGGNYSFYKEQKELHLRGLKRQNDIAKYKLENAAAQAQKEYEKQQQRAAKTRKEVVEGKERDKYIRGMKKDSGEATSKAKSLLFDRIQQEAEEAYEETLADEARKLAFMNIPNTKDNRGKTVFDLENVSLKLNDSVLVRDINFKVMYGDRVVISGDNGSGKSSLVKALLKKVTTKNITKNLGNAEIEGLITINKDLNWVYIDQNYSLINPKLTLIENLMEYNKSYTPDKAKEQLGKFQFKSVAEMNKLGKNLSGGEMVRLIMSMITAFPVDIIILDEPTNNLDVDTVTVLTKSLNNFRGAIIVISHNIDFLNSINIKTSYIIRDNSFSLMKVDPTNREAYYKALVE